WADIAFLTNTTTRSLPHSHGVVGDVSGKGPEILLSGHLAIRSPVEGGPPHDSAGDSHRQNGEVQPMPAIHDRVKNIAEVYELPPGRNRRSAEASLSSGDSARAHSRAR